MRFLLFVALFTLSLPTPARAQAPRENPLEPRSLGPGAKATNPQGILGLGVFTVFLDRLHEQNIDCGCDPCFHDSYPRLFQAVTICMDNSECPPGTNGGCRECGGICTASSWWPPNPDTSTYLSFFALSPDAFRNALVGCNQMVYQVNCEKGPQPDLGAYREEFSAEFGSAYDPSPGDDLEWANLWSDPYFILANNEANATGETVPRSNENGELDRWLHRAGMFARMYSLATQASAKAGLAAVSQQDLNLYLWGCKVCLWYALYWWEPNGIRPVDVGYPTDYFGHDAFQDIKAIHLATCAEPWLNDCAFVNVSASSWGRIKARIWSPVQVTYK